MFKNEKVGDKPVHYTITGSDNRLTHTDNHSHS